VFRGNAHLNKKGLRKKYEELNHLQTNTDLKGANRAGGGDKLMAVFSREELRQA